MQPFIPRKETFIPRKKTFIPWRQPLFQGIRLSFQGRKHLFLGDNLSFQGRKHLLQGGNLFFQGGKHLYLYGKLLYSGIKLSILILNHSDFALLSNYPTKNFSLRVVDLSVVLLEKFLRVYLLLFIDIIEVELVSIIL